jgi:hypothetical protein
MINSLEAESTSKAFAPKWIFFRYQQAPSSRGTQCPREGEQITSGIFLFLFRNGIYLFSLRNAQAERSHR